MFAFLGGIISSSAFGLETADWARNGQPILERWEDKLEHFVPGAVIGAIFGLFLGIFAPNLLEKPAFRKVYDFANLDRDVEVVIQIIALIIAIPICLMIDNGYIQIAVILTVYFCVHSYFSAKSSEN